MVDNALLVAVLVNLVLLVFYCGRLSMKVDSLERWRAEAGDDIKAIRTTTDKLSGILRGQASL